MTDQDAKAVESAINELRNAINAYVLISTQYEGKAPDSPDERRYVYMSRQEWIDADQALTTALGWPKKVEQLRGVLKQILEECEDPDYWADSTRRAYQGIATFIRENMP